MAGLADIFNNPDKLESASRFLMNFGQGLTQANSQGLSPFASLAYGFGAGGTGIQDLKKERQERLDLQQRREILQTKLEREKREDLARKRLTAFTSGESLTGAGQPPDLTQPDARRTVAGLLLDAGDTKEAVDFFGPVETAKAQSPTGKLLRDLDSHEPGTAGHNFIMSQLKAGNRDIEEIQVPQPDGSVSVQLWDTGGEEPKMIKEVGTGRKSPLSTSTVTIEGQKIPESLLKEGIGLNSEADMLQGQVDELAVFGNLAANADTGKITAATLPIQQAFQDIGITLNSEVPLLEAMQAQQNQMALRLRNPESGFGLTGNTSNRDVQFLKNSVAGIEKTPEGNKAILTIMTAKQRRGGALARLKADYIFENGTLKGWGKERKKFVDETPFFTPEEKAFLETISGGPAVGEVQDGYKFLGGDAGDPANWQQVR